MDIHATLRDLSTGHALTTAQAEDVFEAILAGTLDDAQIAAVLALISRRGPTVDELVGGARVMRRHVTRVPIDHDPAIPLLDTCGTGGAPKTFNVSTAAAIVAVAAAPGKIRIAKHGSTSRTNRGSAELMAIMGINTAASPETQARCLREIGLCFCFATHHHPAMKHAAGPRKSLGFPTIFNLLGPLTNPAGARRQLLGCYSRDLAVNVAHTLARLGVDRAMVCTSHDGLDELSTTDTNAVHHVRDGIVTTQVVDAADLGLARATIPDLRVDSVDEASIVIGQIFNPLGDEDLLPDPITPKKLAAARDIIALNAAAALLVADVVPSLSKGLALAQQAIDSRAAQKTLESLAKLSRES